jgi:hypothetical protein
VKQQPSDNLANKVQQLKEPPNNDKSKGFPKKIGVVFLGEKRRTFENKRSKLYLDFDEVACAHILLQMNYIQNLFGIPNSRPAGFYSQCLYLNKR